jgi:hypothetical protein
LQRLIAYFHRLVAIDRTVTGCSSAEASDSTAGAI